MEPFEQDFGTNEVANSHDHVGESPTENGEQKESGKTLEKKRRLPDSWIKDKPKIGACFRHEVYKEAFEVFEEDNAGKISTDHLPEIFRAFEMEPSENHLKDALYDVDFDGRGHLNLEEFCYFMDILLQKKTTFEEIHEAFRMFDRDNDGLITAWEMKQVLTVLGEQVSDEKAMEMIKDVDQTNEGLVNYDNLVSAIIKLNEKP